MAVNMEAMMADAEAKKYLENVQSEMEKNEEVNQMMDAASSLQDLFEVAKKYVVVKFEQFKAICKDAFAYFSKDDKVVLSDDTLEAVVGGGWFGDLWNKCKKAVVAVAVGVVTAAVIGGCVAAGLAATVGTGGIGLAATAAGIAGWSAGAGLATGALFGVGQYLDGIFFDV